MLVNSYIITENNIGKSQLKFSVQKNTTYIRSVLYKWIDAIFILIYLNLLISIFKITNEIYKYLI